MKDTLFTLDGGTTHTRIVLWQGEQVLAHVKLIVGVRDSAQDGHNQRLVTAIKQGLNEVLAMANCPAQAVSRVVASGMLTSPLGLHEVPHCTAPVSVQSLAAAMRAVTLAIWDRPVWLVPGVRNVAQADVTVSATAAASPDLWQGLAGQDMMRGEETETMALLPYLPHTPALVVLPGSHTKLVQLDAQQQITSCQTLLSGELLQALTEHTLLKDSVQGQFVTQLDYPALQAGAAMAAQHGLTRALFMTRVQAVLGPQCADNNAQTRANFLLGAVLSEDAKTITQAELPVLIAGGGMAGEALAYLLAQKLGERCQTLMQCLARQDLSDTQRKDLMNHLTHHLAGHGARALLAKRLELNAAS